MKLSDYNIFVPFHKGHTILYNSISGYYALIKPDSFTLIQRHQNDIVGLRQANNRIYNSLVNNGCIIEQNLNEFETIQNKRFNARFNSYHYKLIINPTMDCNLGCWYCYEDHIKGSEISDETVARLGQHLEWRYAYYPFTQLELSFFGGEPLLREAKVRAIIDIAHAFCQERNVRLTLEFTTNATLVSDTMLYYLQDYPVNFQITLDGDRVRHDNIRCYKNSKTGSFTKIVSNLKRITDSLSNYHLGVRINFDQETLIHGEELLESLSFLNRETSHISLHRVWQIQEKDVDIDQIMEFIAKAAERNICIEYMPLHMFKPAICYADNLNSAAINFDGNVFKCTARKFSTQNREGFLSSNGEIVWDAEKIRNRMFLKTPRICRTCKLYPSCTGFCSQHILERGGEAMCTLLESHPIDYYVTINFQQRYLQHQTQCL
ncbi:MAG: radical SAM protein [Alistipes inops]|uniref:radical SAM protein n=1 Tax=Barnesiella intestinihominis TaxID=487174 RepID=UPI00303F976E